LLGELFWEIEQSNIVVPELRDIKREQIEVLSYSGSTLRFRVASSMFEAHFSWCGDVAPVITQVRDSTIKVLWRTSFSMLAPLRVVGAKLRAEI
jgi:hypothetical protein